MCVPRVCGCLYPTCTGVIVRTPVYTPDHEEDWQHGLIYSLLYYVMTVHT